MTRQLQLANNATSKLASGIGSSDTNLTVLPGDGAKFPSLSGTKYFMATLIKVDGTMEVVKVTARAGDTFTIARAAEKVGASQTAYAFSAGDKVELRLSAEALGAELDRIASSSAHSVQNKSANYTVTANDASDLIRADTGAGDLTVTLPLLSSLSDDFEVIIAKVSGDTHKVTIQCSGSNTINGSTTFELNTQYASAWLIADRVGGVWTAVMSGGGVNSSIMMTDPFTGDGTAKDFTLSGDPGGKNNTIVVVGGVPQLRASYTLSGTKVTLGAAPAAGVAVEVWWWQAANVAALKAAAVSYTPPGSGAVEQTVQIKLDESVSIFNFLTQSQIDDVRTGTWYTGDVAGKHTAMYAAFQNAWAYMLLSKKSLYLPDGWYEIGDENFPFRNTTVPATSLTDCHAVALIAQSSAVTLATNATNGADVLNLNGLQNFSVLGFPTLTGKNGTGATVGSNGCSVTGGYDNLFLQVAPMNCPYVDRTTYVDGGKGLTVQTPVAGQTTPCGTLHAEVRATGCVFGFSNEVDLAAANSMRTDIEVDLVAKDCYIGVVFSAGASTAALTAGHASGVRVRAKTIDCQKDVVLTRCPGIQVDCEVITTKSKAARQLGPGGVAWTVSDTEVSAITTNYAHCSRVAVYGDKGACDYKIKLGGASAGSSGLNGATGSCYFHFNLAGSPSSADVYSIDSGGNSVRESTIVCSNITCTALPTTWYDPTLNNTLTIGAAQRLVGPSIANSLGFVYTDGKTVAHTIRRKNDSIAIRSASSSSASNLSLDVENHLGTTVAGFRNDGTLVTQGRASAASVSTLKQVIYVYDNTGVLIGYVPIYTSFA